MRYRNTKVKIRSLDGGTDFFNIVARVLQGDTPYLFIIYLDYVLQTSIDLIKCDAKLTKIPKRDFIFARVKTGQVGTWSPIE